MNNSELKTLVWSQNRGKYSRASPQNHQGHGLPPSFSPPFLLCGFHPPWHLTVPEGCWSSSYHIHFLLIWRKEGGGEQEQVFSMCLSPLLKRLPRNPSINCYACLIEQSLVTWPHIVVRKPGKWLLLGTLQLQFYRGLDSK